MRRLNYSRPGKVARVSGKRLGDVGRPKLRRERQRRKLDYDKEKAASTWHDSNYRTFLPLLPANATIIELVKFGKPIIAIVAGDVIKINSEEIKVNSVNPKGTEFTVSRAHNGTKAASHTQSDQIYVDHP